MQYACKFLRIYEAPYLVIEYWSRDVALLCVG